jgi:hypothetical protein
MDAGLAEVLRATERERLRALVAVDTATAGPLHAADYQLVTPGGSALTKSDYLGALEQGQMRYLEFEPVSPIEVRGGADSAILRYRVHIRVQEGPETADLVAWHTDYYERRDGRWQAVWSQATRIAV